MGPSGSGKTTLLTLMGCLREVHGGSVRLLDQELFASDEAARVDMRRRLGFIFQAHNLHDSLTARQNVMMGLQVHGRGDRDRQAAAADCPASALMGQIGVIEERRISGSS
jgi:putative ABC transport system ATP-binding protein